MTEQRPPRGFGFSNLPTTQGSRLAHWPPPYRGASSKPIIMQHPQGVVPKRATARGWRLTRAIFSEFEED